MRRLWIVLTLWTMLLASCGAPQPSGDATPAVPGATPTRGSESVTISFAVWEYERAAYEPLADRFTAENPTIKVVLVSLDDVMMFEPGSEGPTSPLDMLRRIVSAADTAPAFALTPEAFGTPLLLDLKPLMDADATFQRDDFLPGTIERYTAKGGVWALPRYHSVPLIVYNRALFQNANLPEPRPGWTWDDLMAAAERLTERSGLTTLTYGFMEPSSGLLPLLGLLDQQGINPLTAAAEETDLTARRMSRQSSACRSGIAPACWLNRILAAPLLKTPRAWCAKGESLSGVTCPTSAMTTAHYGRRTFRSVACHSRRMPSSVPFSV